MALNRFVEQEEDEFVTREERLRPFRDQAFVGPSGDLPGYEQARGQGYSPEAANIAARHGIQGGGVEQTIGSPLVRFERQEAQGGMQFRPSAEGDVASRQFAENRQAAEMGLANRAENQIAQMRMRAGLSGSGVTGMTREEAFRRAEGGMNRMERGVNLEVRDRADERANLTQRDVATTAGNAQLGVARYGADAQRDVATTAAGAQRDVARLGADAQTGVAKIGADAQRDVALLGDLRSTTAPREFMGKLNEALALKHITQEQYDMELERRKRQDSAMEAFLRMMDRDVPPTGAGGAPAAGAPARYNTEAEARSAGAKAGDEVFMPGVGRVRLR